MSSLSALILKCLEKKIHKAIKIMSFHLLVIIIQFLCEALFTLHLEEIRLGHKYFLWEFFGLSVWFWKKEFF